MGKRLMRLAHESFINDGDFQQFLAVPERAIPPPPQPSSKAAAIAKET